MPQVSLIQVYALFCAFLSVVLVGCEKPVDHSIEWARVVEAMPDAEVIADADTRRAIRATGLPWRVIDDTSGVEFLLVPAGTYRRGAAPDDPYDRANERPQHTVTISEPFYLGRYEVTNAQMRRYQGDFSSGTFYRNDSLSLDGDTYPAVDVTWSEASAFALHFGYRLPTEAEWEYAARAGVQTRYPWGNDDDAGKGWGNVFNASMKDRLDMDWDAFPFEDGYDATAPVGTFRPNAWGFFDMLGNAWEYVGDGYVENEYTFHADGVVDPYRAEGEVRTLRGGGFGNAPRGSGIPYRFGMNAQTPHDGNGFRVARGVHP